MTTKVSIMETLQVKPNTGKGHMTYQLTPNWGGRGCCTSRRTAASQRTLDLQKNRKKKHEHLGHDFQKMIKNAQNVPQWDDISSSFEEVFSF
jgi:hypothetical protein